MRDWFVKVQISYFRHPKTVLLRTTIGKEADVYPIRLWGWATEYATSGVLGGTPEMIEAAAQWVGKPKVLHSALMAFPPGEQAGFLEADGVTLHNWAKHMGDGINKYENKLKDLRDDYATWSDIAREGGPATLIVQCWNKNGVGMPISLQKGVRIVQTMLDRGAKANVFHQAVMDEKGCRGKKIWEVLEPLTPNPSGNGKGGVGEQLVKWAKEQSAKGTGS